MLNAFKEYLSKK